MEVPCHGMPCFLCACCATTQRTVPYPPRVRANLTPIQLSRQTIQGSERLYKGPTDYTKPRQTIRSFRKTIQRHKILDKTPKYQTKTYNIRQRPKSFNKSSNRYAFYI